MARDIYNFIWVTPEAGAAVEGPAAQHTMNTAAVHRAVTPGVILFPSFMTPLVHVDGHDGTFFELLIATKDALTRDMVNRQLKISAGLRGEKPYDPEPLFAAAHGHIVVAATEDVDDDRETIVETHTKFAGILHPSYAEALEAHDIRRIYKVKVATSGLPETSSPDERNYSTTVRKFVRYRQGSRGVYRQTAPAVVGSELSDRMIREMLRRRFGRDSSSNPNTIPGRGRYAFPMRGNTVDLRRVDPNRPIQSYHPLVIISGDDAKRYLDFGHVSDIHINTRWQFLGKSPARVIEYGDGVHEDESPPIGDMLGENNRSFHNVLDRLCHRADAMIVGGDLIDHIRNSYDAAQALASNHSVRGIWDMMDMQDGYDESSYPIGLDLIAFFSFMYDAMVERAMPFFAITGNHDCYVDAYGISPRVGAVAGFGSRTNEGIPADLNLTFYESLLAFGPTGGWLAELGSSFSHEWFDWFHLVLTPFNDWWFKFPHQSLVGFGWGDSDDLYADEQGAGHLPRSEDGVSDGQLALLQRAVGERDERKVILTSHFTFLSFADNIPMDPPGNARHATGTFSNAIRGYNDFELGTFESNRGELIDILDANQLQVVLTGHSHRRGLYLLGEYSRLSGIAATLYDTDPNYAHGLSAIPERLRDREPFVVVSDSGGPYPRHNRHGEFLGWGSDRPGGTLIRFAADGRLSRVITYDASRRAKPRAAVAMDYADVSEDGVFVDNRLSTNWVTRYDHSGRSTPTWVVNANLTTQVHSTWQIYIEKLIFAGYHAEQWIRIETHWDATHNGFVVPASQAGEFRTWLTAIRTPTRFLSIKMGTRSAYLRERYDWASHWNFEVGTQTVTRNRRLLYAYHIRRPQRALEVRGGDIEWREIPNFDWRQANDPKYA